MHELVKADGIACAQCAARTKSIEGDVCVPWKLGTKNRLDKKRSKNKFGVNFGSGTTLRPDDCPHPDNSVSSTANAQVVLRKQLGR